MVAVIIGLGAFTTIYTTLGGFQASVWTGVVKAAILAGMIFAILFLAFSRVDGGIVSVGSHTVAIGAGGGRAEGVVYKGDEPPPGSVLVVDNLSPRLMLAYDLRGDGRSVLRTGAAAHLPGNPVVIHTPGHTDGHCALHFPDRDVVITGDALVTLDPYTGFTGPHIVSAAATADTRTALASLSSLAATGARTLLPGHGLPDHGGIAAAVEQAVARGAT